MHQIIMLLRGAQRRCPRCGERKIARHWLKLKDRCPRCALYFEREEGYWTGAIALNTLVTELLFAVLLVGVAIWTWPNIPTLKLLIAGVLLNAIVPLLFYPISKTLWIAIDLILHPLEPKEELEVSQLLRVRREREIFH